MTFFATCTADVFRGTTTDSYGDETAGTTAAIASIPMAISERSRNVFDPSSGEFRTVRTVSGRCMAGTDIRESDRVYDRTFGALYTVRALGTRGSIVGHTDLEIELVRTAQNR